MDIETVPHAMYFSSNKQTITKINQVPYQVIDYDDKGMFQAKLMDNTQVEIFVDNGATPSILPLNVYVVPHFGICPILKQCCTVLEFQNGAPVLKWCCTILEHLVLPHFKTVLPHFGTFIFSI